MQPQEIRRGCAVVALIAWFSFFAGAGFMWAVYNLSLTFK